MVVLTTIRTASPKASKAGLLQFGYEGQNYGLGTRAAGQPEAGKLLLHAHGIVHASTHLQSPPVRGVNVRVHSSVQACRHDSTSLCAVN